MTELSIAIMFIYIEPKIPKRGRFEVKYKNNAECISYLWAKIADANDFFSTNITRSNAPQTCRRCGVRLS